jgi:hypothetical protein
VLEVVELPCPRCGQVVRFRVVHLDPKGGSMNIKGRLEKAEVGAGIVGPFGVSCALCALMLRGARRVYGEDFAPPVHTTAACAELRRNLLKVYGGGNGGGIEVTA